MTMRRLLVRVPEELALRLRQRVPARDRGAFMRRLLEQALPPGEDHDDALYRAAIEVEKDERLEAEMSQWECTVGDGLTPEASAPPRR